MKEAAQKNRGGSNKEPIKQALADLQILINENDKRIKNYVAAGGEEHDYLDGKKEAFNEVRLILLKFKKAL
jgi:hypothetical protein